MDIGIGGHAVYKVRDRVNERVLVTDDVTGRPPGAKVRMSRLRAKNCFEAWLIGRVTAIAVLKLVHPFETKADRSFAAVDFPPIIILMPGRKARGFKGAVRSLSDVFA